MQKSEKTTLSGKWKFIIQEENGNTRIIEKTNVLPTVGRVAMAKQLAGTNTTVMGDNLYIACGNDATAPVVADTVLGNETTRKAVSSATNLSVVGIISTFFAVGEATGTHQEFGLFGDGDASTASASADTGILYSHVTQAVTISATETLTVEFSINFAV